jgi:hypothetical protein
MMEATDLRQGDDFAEVGWLYRPGSGASFASERCVRAPW